MIAEGERGMVMPSAQQGQPDPKAFLTLALNALLSHAGMGPAATSIAGGLAPALQNVANTPQIPETVATTGTQPQQQPPDLWAKEIEQLNKQLQSLQSKSEEAKAKLGQLTAPKPTNPLGKQDALPLGLGLLIAMLTHAKGQDIAEFGQGYLGAKQGQADRTDALNQQEFQFQRQQALQDQLRLEKDQDYARNRIDSLGDQRRDQFFKNEQDLKDMEKAKYVQDQLNSRAQLRDPARVETFKALSKTPEGRQVLASRAGMGDEDALAALGQLTVDEQKKVADTGLVQAKTKAQEVTNKYLPETLRAKIKLTDKQAEFIETKIKYYPEYLQATMARVEIAKLLAGNTIANTTYDNQLNAWKAQGAGKVAQWQKEIAGHIARQKAIDKQLADIQKEGVAKNVNPMELQRQHDILQARIDELQGMIDGQLESVPEYGDPSMAPPVNPFSGTIGSGTQVVPEKKPNSSKPATKPKTKTKSKNDGWTIH